MITEGWRGVHMKTYTSEDDLSGESLSDNLSASDEEVELFVVKLFLNKEGLIQLFM